MYGATIKMIDNRKFEDASFRVSTMLDDIGQWLMRSYV